MKVRRFFFERFDNASLFFFLSIGWIGGRCRRGEERGELPRVYQYFNI